MSIGVSVTPHGVALIAMPESMSMTKLRPALRVARSKRGSSVEGRSAFRNAKPGINIVKNRPAIHLRGTIIEFEGIV